MNSQDYNLIILGNVPSHETFTPPRGFVRFCDFPIPIEPFQSPLLGTNKWQKAAENNCGQCGGGGCGGCISFLLIIYYLEVKAGGSVTGLRSQPPGATSQWRPDITDWRLETEGNPMLG